MLLINCHEAKFRKTYPFLDERVRTYHNVDLPGFDMIIECLASNTFYASGKQAYPHAEGRQELIERMGVLSREDFRRRHESCLKTTMRCLHCSETGDYSLARSHISLKQAIHRRFTLKILNDLPRRKPLCIRKLKR